MAPCMFSSHCDKVRAVMVWSLFNALLYYFQELVPEGRVLLLRLACDEHDTRYGHRQPDHETYSSQSRPTILPLSRRASQRPAANISTASNKDHHHEYREILHVSVIARPANGLALTRAASERFSRAREPLWTR